MNVLHTVRITNHTAVNNANEPLVTEIKCARESIPAILEFHEGYYSGDSYDVTIDGVAMVLSGHGELISPIPKRPPRPAHFKHSERTRLFQKRISDSVSTVEVVETETGDVGLVDLQKARESVEHWLDAFSEIVEIAAYLVEGGAFDAASVADTVHMSLVAGAQVDVDCTCHRSAPCPACESGERHFVELMEDLRKGLTDHYVLELPKAFEKEPADQGSW